MKNIFAFFLILSLSLVAHSLRAQSLETKCKQQLEERKKHREDVLKKRLDQDRQQQAERKGDVGSNAQEQETTTKPSANQKTPEVKPDSNSATHIPARQQQGIIVNNSRKKEDINQ